MVIIGVGTMGGEAARAAKALGLRVLGVRRKPIPHRWVHEMYPAESLRRILPRADILIVTTPLTPETRGLIGKKELDLLKPTSGLINMARAGVVDYEALRTKLQQGELSGAILDVFDPEPLPKSSPLWDCPNLVITPHVSADAPDYNERMLAEFVDNFRRFVSGKPFRNRVDPQRGY